MCVPKTLYASHLRLTALLITNISTLRSTSRRMRDRDARLGLTGTPAAESTAGILSARAWRLNHAASAGVGCLNLVEDLKRSTRSFAGAIAAAETETQGSPPYFHTHVFSFCRDYLKHGVRLHASTALGGLRDYAEKGPMADELKSVRVLRRSGQRSPSIHAPLPTPAPMDSSVGVSRLPSH